MSKAESGESPVVLHVRVVTGSGGGPEKTILNSPRYLSDLGFQSACAYLHPPDDPGFQELMQRGLVRGARVLSVPDRGPWDLRVITRLLKICRRERVTIWHGHDYKSNALGLLLRKLWRMHLVTTVHGWVTYTRRTPLYYGIDRRCLVRYERVICVSNDLQKICLGIGVPLQRCVTVENAIDTEQYSRRHSIDEAKRSLNLPVDRPLIGAVGRLSDEKGFDVLIRAVARLLKQGENVGLSILGDGIARPRLQALIDALGVADRVSLVGYCSNPIRWYHAMDIYALSSIREGLPNALLEAMALEVPVVATRVAGVPRLIEDGKTGLLVEPNSVDDLVQALQRVLHDAELRASLRSAGRNIIIQRHDFRDRMEKVCRVYHEVLREAPLVRRSVQQP